MANFFETLFGSDKIDQKTNQTQVTTSTGKGDVTKTDQTYTPMDLTPEAYKGLQGGLAAALQSLMGGSGGGVSGIPKYQGPLTAGLGAAEQNVLNQLQGSGMGRQGYLEGVIGGKYLPGQEGSNPFLTAAIEAAQRPTLQGLEETLSRTLPGRFTQGGQMVQPQGSSAFDRAAGIASRGAAQTLGDIATNISAGAYESERGRQQEAIQLGQSEVNSMVQNLQAQALPRLIQDLGIERGLAQFDSQLNALLNVLGLTQGTAAPIFGGGTQTGTQVDKNRGKDITTTTGSTTQEGGGDGIFGQIFKGGAFNPLL